MLKRLVLCGALALGLVSCTQASQVGCTVETAVASTVAVAIASELQCTNQAAIMASIQTAANKAGVCQSSQAKAIGMKKPALGSVAGDICNTVASTLLTVVINGSIPTAWGCSGGAAMTQVTSYVTAACNKTFP
jgi:hypothetical protein